MIWSKKCQCASAWVKWFSRIDTRMKLYFGKECDCSSVFNVVPPTHPEEDAPMLFFESLCWILQNDCFDACYSACMSPVAWSVLDKECKTDLYRIRRGRKYTWRISSTGEPHCFCWRATNWNIDLDLVFIWRGSFFSAHDILSCKPPGSGEPVLWGVASVEGIYRSSLQVGWPSLISASIFLQSSLRNWNGRPYSPEKPMSRLTK